LLAEDRSSAWANALVKEKQDKAKNDH
jgi:hypothetical protein